MTSSEQIVARFGRPLEMSRKTGIPRTTIDYWLKVGYVPYTRHDEILAHARRLGVRLRKVDFVSAA